MKKKLVGIFVCMLLIAIPVLSVAGAFTNYSLIIREPSDYDDLINGTIGFKRGGWSEMDKLTASDGQDYDVSTNKPMAETVVIAPNSTFFNTIAFQSYITHRQTQGQKITCVSLEPLGNPDADQIREFLKNNYLDGKRRYLLILGDEYTIPCKYCYNFTAVGYLWDCYSDYYYGDLEGDWDKNNDGRYGEFLNDSVDFLDPEFIVGRLPVTQPFQVDEILSRTINYEKETASWKKDMLCAAGSISIPGDASIVLNHIDRILTRHKYPITTMADSWFFKKPDKKLTENSFRETWKQGKFGFVYVMCHGSPTGLYYLYHKFFSIYDVEDLNPLYPGIFISLGCNNNQQYIGDTLGKELIKKRMVAAVASTTVTDPGYFPISGPWAEMFFPRMYLLKNYELGNAMQKTKALYYLLFVRFNNNYNIGFGLQTNLLAFTIYGDPLIKQY
jgi:hypothetical protein